MYASMEASRHRPQVFVSVPNVRAICNGLSLICALADGQRFGVPSNCLGKHSRVRRPGDYGTLVVLSWFAEAHHLPTAVSDSRHGALAAHSI